MMYSLVVHYNLISRLSWFSKYRIKPLEWCMNEEKNICSACLLILSFNHLRFD